MTIMRLTRRQFAAGAALAGLTGSAVCRAARAAGAAPFRTVAVNHLSYRCTDYKKQRDFLIGLFGLESAAGKDDGRQAHLMLGPKVGGTYLIPRLPSQNAGPTPAGQKSWIQSFGLTIGAWDEGFVQAALEKRGLKPVKNGESFRIIDPFGYPIALCSPRMTAFGAGPARPPAAVPNLTPVAVNHIVYVCDDYRKGAQPYIDLMGMREVPGSDNGSEVRLAFYRPGETPINTPAGTPSPFLIMRNGPPPPDKTGYLDHIAYTIADWNTARVRTALEQHGYKPREDHEHSMHVADAYGYHLQISGLQMNAYTG